MDEDEERIAKFLSGYGLSAEQFEKAEVGATKTPDFRVRGAESEITSFYCEVKSIQRDGWLDRKFAEAEPGELVGGARKDPIFNRLIDDIHKSCETVCRRQCSRSPPECPRIRKS